MMRTYVELSGESLSLAAAEAVAAAEALGGHAVAPRDVPFEGMVAVDLPGPEGPGRWAARLALARRCLAHRAAGATLVTVSEELGASRASAAFRRLGRPSAADDPLVPTLGRAFKQGGGTIDLERPQRRFWIHGDRDGVPHLFEELSLVDRTSITARRMPLLPFQRPVSLPPRLARAAANLTRAVPGDAVLDPFLGTGALLAEAALLGARTFGIDRDPTMVRGALRNFEHLGVVPEELLVGDAAEVEFRDPALPFAAILTDPPYGRSSSTGGEGADALIQRVLPRWAERVRPGGRLVIVVPVGARALPSPWTLALAVPVRVHRSLTREFRVYERADP